MRWPDGLWHTPLSHRELPRIARIWQVAEAIRLSASKERGPCMTGDPGTAAMQPGDSGSTTSPTLSRWTVTSSAPCWSLPGSFAGRACADLPARAQRPARLRGYRCRHRAPGPRARAPDADDHPQGRQGRHQPAGAADRPRDRPGHRGPDRRAGVPGRGRATAGPARRGAGRPQDCPPRQDRQGRHAPHAQTRLHHRRPGCLSATAGCARRGVARGPTHHDPV